MCSSFRENLLRSAHRRQRRKTTSKEKLTQTASPHKRYRQSTALHRRGQPRPGLGERERTSQRTWLHGASNCCPTLFSAAGLSSLATGGKRLDKKNDARERVCPSAPKFKGRKKRESSAKKKRGVASSLSFISIRFSLSPFYRGSLSPYLPRRRSQSVSCSYT